MFHDRPTADAEPGRDSAYGQFPLGKQIEHSPPCGIGNGLQNRANVFQAQFVIVISIHQIAGQPAASRF